MKKSMFLVLLLTLGCDSTARADRTIDESVTELLDLYKKTQMQEQRCMQQLDNTAEFLNVQRGKGLVGAFVGCAIGVCVDVIILMCVDIPNTSLTKLCGGGIVMGSGLALYKIFTGNHDTIRKLVLLQELTKSTNPKTNPFPKSAFWNDKLYPV